MSAGTATINWLYRDQSQVDSQCEFSSQVGAGYLIGSRFPEHAQREGGTYERRQRMGS